jgi:tRNA threonylcarbamoyladenosine biosynthesis protein TsaE
MKTISDSVANTVKIGSLIAKHVKAGDIVCLFGQLGSGKTVLTKGIAKGLGVKVDKVISPSFVLLRQHSKGRLPLYHFDLYRLDDIGDILGLGYEEYFYDKGVTIIEWAERLKSLMPEEYLKVKLSCKSDSKRVLEFSAIGKRPRELLKEINADYRD